MLLGHQGASARTDCMYLSIASCVAASSHDSGSQTVRLGTSIAAADVTPSCAFSNKSSNCGNKRCAGS